MGSPLSPIIADLFMKDLEQALKPSLWIQYVNDTFVIWPQSEEDLFRFHDHLNYNLHPSNSQEKMRNRED